ncbi:MAG: hypothetical protein NC313_15100 [Butyrivibrio sp.]|nr:hypothetical protein [Butyrivibrio sp.]
MSEQKSDISNLFPAYIIIFTGCFMLFFYEPMLMYSTNMDDFWFDMGVLLTPTVIMFLCFLASGIAVITVIYYINKLLGSKLILYKAVVLTGFLIFLLAYIQGNLLIIGLPPLDGSIIIWENYGKNENVTIFIAAIVIFVVVIACLQKYKFAKTIKTAAALAAMICAMLLVTMVTEIIRNNAWENKESAFFSMKNFDTISENRNFLIFLVDAVDAGEFSAVLDAHPEYCSVFDDFTYYEDANSVYAFTKHTVPLVLSGNMDLNENFFWKYSNDAFNNSKLFAALSDTGGYKINIYDTEITWSGEREYEVCNAVSDSKPHIHMVNFCKQELKYMLFKYLPYGMKKFSKIGSLNFEGCRLDDMGLTENNRIIYDHIIDNPELAKDDANIFQFIHVEGAHIPYDYDEELNTITNGSYSQKIIASIVLVNAYIQRLKANGAYDNSIIIIMADHGETTKNSDAAIFERFNPILLIKGFDEKHALIRSDAKVSYLDLPDTYRDLLDGRQSTELFADIPADRIRKFIWYRYEKENHMVEYETDGTMKDVGRFKQTGNIYDR